MFLDMAAYTEGLSKPNHWTFCVIQVDAGNVRHHEFLALLADQSVDSDLTLSDTGNVFPRTKILQISMKLAAHGKACTSHSRVHSSELFDSQESRYHSLPRGYPWCAHQKQESGPYHDKF